MRVLGEKKIKKGNGKMFVLDSSITPYSVIIGAKTMPHCFFIIRVQFFCLRLSFVIIFFCRFDSYINLRKYYEK